MRREIWRHPLDPTILIELDLEYAPNAVGFLGPTCFGPGEPHENQDGYEKTAAIEQKSSQIQLSARTTQQHFSESTFYFSFENVEALTI